MNGPEHYQRAEQLAAEASACTNEDPQLADTLIKLAHLHVALAHVVIQAPVYASGNQHRWEWNKAVGIK